MTRILIMTGEASGDQHGAKLAEALKRLDPDIELLGLGGKRMQAEGVQILSGIERLDIIGVPSLKEARQAIRMYRALSDQLATLDLDAVVLIDNPGLNLRLARVAKRAGHRVIYFVAPQLWAWNASRIKKMKRFVDLVLVILPFERDIYLKADIRCDFVGHPLLDDIAQAPDRPALRARLRIEPDACVIGLLPGSRERETRMLLPTMLDAAGRLAGMRRNDQAPLRFLLGQVPTLPEAMFAQILDRAPVPVTVARGGALDVMAASDAMLVASGTATLQTAFTGTPMAIVYRSSALTAFLARRLARVKWIGLANVVAGRQIVPELLQEECTADRMADAIQHILDDPEAFARAQSVARELRDKFGPPGAAMRAAKAVLAECRGQRR
jgi:lipid-A-disaccharide synthase